MKIEDYENSFEIMKSFDVFYYLNGRFPATNSLLWISDGDEPDFFFSGEKISITGFYGLFICFYNFFQCSIYFWVEREKFQKMH